MNNRAFFLVGILAAASLGAAAVPPAAEPAASGAAAAPAQPLLTPQQSQFFEAKIRPLLSDRCYKCHSMESAKVKGGLLLDSREGWMKGGENGVVIVPGNSSKSRLITAVLYTDADLQMPPKGEKLTAQQIADLKAWVDMGAPDPRTLGAGAAKLSGLTDKARSHWAYQPVKSPPVPDVKDKAWVSNPVDAFVLAKLEANNLKPNKAAAKEALMRRAYYDLIGLPPNPQELQDFLHDRSPAAFEKVVDHLLASPHYGERWGRFWLDSARYADTTGSLQLRREDYRYPYAWTYRDWVINAFNTDMPYDQFLMNQIAADSMPESAKDSHNLAALGFLTVGKRFANNNDTIDERIDTLCKAMLGMTVSCARCHDHKFDPIPTMDYYSLHGVFTSLTEPTDKPLLDKPASTADLDVFNKKMAAMEERDREMYFDLVSEKGSEFRKKAGLYVLAKAYSRKGDAAQLKARIKLVGENKLDPWLLGAVRLKPEVFAPLQKFSGLAESEWKDRVKDYLDDIAGGNRGRLNPLVREAFKNVPPESIHSLEDVAAIYGKLFAGLGPQADAYIKACRRATESSVPGFDKSLVELLEVTGPIEPAPMITTDHLREMIPRLPLKKNEGYNTFLFASINELEMMNPASPPRAMVVEDLPHPHDDPVFIRGEAGSRGQIAPRRFLEILSDNDRKPFKIGSGRLELAQAIASRNNPITARVMINRIWLHHFGEGFVRTPDDLGVQSEPPSHPELIDYLSARFMDEGWSVKKIHRLIMLSNAYQQSADTNPAFTAKDPENRLLWRANLRRLDFEAIRDTMLLFTGNLDAQVGGRPVNLTDEPYSYRRSIYGYIDRGQLPELMSQFDFSDPDRPNSHRTSTIVPQQALFFMNSPMAADVARRVTTRPEFTSAQSDPARVRALYLALFQREPRAAEVRLAAEFFNAHDPTKIYVAEPPRKPEMKNRSSKKTGNNGSKAIQNQGEMVERKPLTLWEEYAQALLFTNEVAYVN